MTSQLSDRYTKNLASGTIVFGKFWLGRMGDNKKKYDWEKLEPRDKPWIKLIKLSDNLNNWKNEDEVLIFLKR